MKKRIPEATRLLIVALLFGIRLSGAAQQPTTDGIATPDNCLSLLNPWGTMRTDTRYFFRDVTQTRWVTNNHSSGVRLGLTYSFGKRFRTRQGNETIEQTDRKGK